MSRIAEILVGLALAASLLTTNDVSARAACPIRLDAVEAVGPDLVWIGGTGCGRALIEAWDGTGWQMSWMGPQSGGSIRAIAANTAHEAWAVGEQWSARLDHYVPAIRHWDGHAWHRIAAPWRSTQASLYDVDVRGDAVWAVGEGPDSMPLVITWTGIEFKRVPMPLLVRGSGGLTGVALTGERRVWVVDGYGRAFARSGTVWRETPLPDLPGQVPAVRSIDAGGRVLAVGDTGYFPEAGPDTRALSTRWNGSRWMVDRLGPVGELDDVEVVSADRAWAVGCAGRDVGCYSNRFSPLAMRRNAEGVWRSVPVPYTGPIAALTSVDVYGTLGVWVVGRWVDRTGTNHPLIYHREGGEWVRSRPVERL